MKYRIRAEIRHWGCEYVLEEKKNFFSQWKYVMQSASPKRLEEELNKIKEFSVIYYEEKQK